MKTIIDTNVAVHLRDDERDTVERVARLPAFASMSILTVVELEAGLHRAGDDLAAYRARLDAIFCEFQVLPLGPAEVVIYAGIVERCGYSRRRIIDRLIAATAIAADATLITMNGADFRDIPGLKLDIWSAP